MSPSKGAPDAIVESYAAVSQPRRRKISTTRKLAYTSFCTVLVLFMLEGAVRLRAWHRFGTTGHVVDKIRMWEHNFPVPRPNASVKGSMCDIRINSLGFRGDEFLAEKPPGCIRIAAIGASTTFCIHASSNQHTWPHRLQEMLRSEYPNQTIEVVNAAFPGYRIETSKRNLEHRVLQLQPDVVIYYEASNDITADIDKVAEAHGLVASDNKGAGFRFGFLARHSSLVRLLNVNFSNFFQRQTGKLSTVPASMPQHFVEQIAAIHALCRDNDSKLVLSAFVTKMRRDQPPDEQMRNAAFSLYYMRYLTIEAVMDAFDLYNAAVYDYASQNQLPFCADGDSIPGDDLHFVDSIHFSDKGAEKMAERFFKFFVQERLIEQVLAGRGTRPSDATATLSPGAN